MKMQLKETHPTNLEELKVEIKKLGFSGWMILST
jgi:hypothetical protein